MNKIRKRIFEVIEIADESDRLSKLYDMFMIVCILLSIIPMCFRNQTVLFKNVEEITTVIFIVDYILRFATADLKLQKGAKSFVKYPFTFMAIIDMLSILPSINLINKGFKALRTFRLVRVFRVFKVFRTFRYSKNIEIISSVFQNQKDSLIVVCVLAFGYIFITALIMFNIEPETFHTFFDALYWATVSLTTVGYGDIYAVSTIGKIITMISSLVGIAIVALPAGIITAGHLDELNKR